MTKAENYAVLFSGGGSSPTHNNRYYYDSLRETYNILLERGVDAENIIIAYADGVGSDNISGDFDSWIVPSSISDAVGVNNFYDDFGLNNSAREKFDQLFSELGYPGDTETFSIDSFESINDLSREVEFAISNLNEYSSKNGLGLYVEYKIDLADQSDPTLLAENPYQAIVDFNILAKSDFSFAKLNGGSEVIAATQNALQRSVKSLSEKIDENDSLFVWTFDHGSSKHASLDHNEGHMVPPAYKNINAATLTPWRSDGISSIDFANIFQDVTSRSKNTTFAFAQCFSGGLLQAISDDPDYAKNWFGMAATNQYEPSLNSDFADGIAKGLRQGDNTGRKLFDTAKKADSFAPRVDGKPLQYIGNEYPFDNWGVFKYVEHPWSFGSGELPIFVNDVAFDGVDSQRIKLLDPESLVDSQFTFSFSLSVSEDQTLDLFGGLKPYFGDLSDLSFEGYAPSMFGTIDYEEKFDSLIYTPLSDRYGQDSVVLRFDDGDISFDVKVDIDVESVNDAPMAVDDFFQISSGERDILIDVDDAPGFLDDTDVDGDELSIASYSAPDNGTIEKVGDFLFEYQPNAGFVGSDSFLYVLSDGEAFDVAEVLINVVDSSL